MLAAGPSFEANNMHPTAGDAQDLCNYRFRNSGDNVPIDSPIYEQEKWTINRAQIKSKCILTPQYTLR